MLPEERTGLFIETHENAAVALVPFISRRFVVRADENLAASDGDVAVALRAELGDPFEILDGVGADVVRAGLELDLGEYMLRMFLPPHCGQSAACAEVTELQTPSTRDAPSIKGVALRALRMERVSKIVEGFATKVFIMFIDSGRAVEIQIVFTG